MPRLIAFLRGINAGPVRGTVRRDAWARPVSGTVPRDGRARPVSGTVPRDARARPVSGTVPRDARARRRRAVKMAWLRGQFAGLGFSRVETFIASGNVIFDSRAGNAAALERRIGERLRQALGYDVVVFVRTVEELRAIAAFTPFPAEEPGPLLPDNVILLAEPPNAAAASGVLALRTPTDHYRIRGREIYWRRRRKPGAPAYSTAPLEKVLRCPFTVRTAATIGTIAAMCRTNNAGSDAEAAVPRRANAGRGQRRAARRGARRPRPAAS